MYTFFEFGDLRFTAIDSNFFVTFNDNNDNMCFFFHAKSIFSHDTLPHTKSLRNVCTIYRLEEFRLSSSVTPLATVHY